MSKPLIIYEEYRLHTMIFTLKTVSTYLWGLYALPYFGDTYQSRILQFVFLQSHHLVVDEITRRHGPEDKSITTVRVDGNRIPWQVQRFFSFYQFIALASMSVPSERMADMGWNTLIAIQSSAFLMTLFRKGLIRWKSHAFWYGVCLVLSYNYIRLMNPGF